jgi:hypothetical protein
MPPTRRALAEGEGRMPGWRRHDSYAPSRSSLVDWWAVTLQVKLIRNGSTGARQISRTGIGMRLSSVVPTARPACSPGMLARQRHNGTTAHGTRHTAHGISPPTVWSHVWSHARHGEPGISGRIRVAHQLTGHKGRPKCGPGRQAQTAAGWALNVGWRGVPAEASPADRSPPGNPR